MVSLAFPRGIFGALPDGYTQLAFLESRGAQYIDTGVTFASTNGFSIRYQTMAPIPTQLICGSRIDDGDTRCVIGSNYTKYNENDYGDNYFYFGWNGLPLKLIGWAYRIKDHDMIRIDVNYRNSGKFISKEESCLIPSLTPQECPFYLFAAKTASSGTINYSYARISMFRMTAGDSVIMDCVPARRDSDGELGMYDLKNGAFLVNQGTGSFIGGYAIGKSEDGDRITFDYLESSGAQYVDTGMKFGPDNGFSVTFQPLKGVSNQIICGSRIDSGDTRCIAGLNGWYAYIGWNGLLTANSVSVWRERTITVNYGNDGTFNCCSVTNGVAGALTEQNRSCYLFAGNSAGSTIYSHCRISDFSATCTNEVVMRMSPARRLSDGAQGMYDSVSREFRANAGTAAFLEGSPVAAPTGVLPEEYAELDFIESTGSQYINTGVKCASNITLRATIYNSRPEAQHFIGARAAASQNALHLSFLTAGNNAGYSVSCGNESRYSLFGANPAAGVGDAFHEFTVGGWRYVLIDDHYRPNTGNPFSWGNFATDLDIYTFALNQNGSPHSAKSYIRMSALKIYRDGWLVRDFVPVMSKNDFTPGLYDLCTETFYGNLGEGRFKAGEIVRGMDAPDMLSGEGIAVAEIAGSESEEKTFTAKNSGLYRLWLQYKAGEEGTGHSVQVQMDGKSVGTVIPATTYGWSTAHFDVRLRGGIHSLAFRGAGDGKSTVIDAVSVRRLLTLPSGFLISIK